MRLLEIDPNHNQLFSYRRVQIYNPGIYIDWDKLYGHAFKVTDLNGKTEDNKPLSFSIITPFQHHAWTSWKEKPESFEHVKANINDPKWLPEYIYNQIISAAVLLDLISYSERMGKK